MWVWGTLWIRDKKRCLSGTEGGSSLPDLEQAISAARARRGDEAYRILTSDNDMILTNRCWEE
jgi:hypothetical protein